MNAVLTFAGVVAPAAAVALAAGGLCPPEQCSGAAGQTLVLQPARAGDAFALAAQVAALPLAMQPQDQVQAHSQVRTHIKVVQQDDTGTYELVIENGKPSAKVNGEAVPGDRIKQRPGGAWVIESEDGQTLATFHITAAPQAPHVRALAGDFNRDVSAFENLPLIEGLRPGGQLNLQMNVEQPRTMFGVVMGPAPEGAGEGADGGGILIERVIEGLPADRAGISSGDIIVAIDSAGGATPERLRAVLREKSPGDAVTVTLRRNGEEKQVTVKLEAFDSARLTQHQLAPMPQALRWSASAGSLGALSDDARRQMEDALQSLREAEQLASGEAREAHEQARNAIEQFVAALERMEAEGLSTGDAMRGDLGHWFRQFKDDQMVWGDKPGMVFTLPPNSLQFDWRTREGASAGGNTETAEPRIRKDDVEARLNAMAQRLERIEKLLEKLANTPAPADDPNRSDR